MRRAGVLLAVLAAAGCGGDDDKRSETPDASRTQGTTAQTATTPTPPPAPKRARSVRQCVKLWNADALPPENSQVSANEFLADLAPVRVHVAYERGHCFVVAPIGKRRIQFSTAPNGRRPFTNPERRNLKPGERVPYNARADRDGLVELD